MKKNACKILPTFIDNHLTKIQDLHAESEWLESFTGLLPDNYGDNHIASTRKSDGNKWYSGEKRIKVKQIMDGNRIRKSHIKLAFAKNKQQKLIRYTTRQLERFPPHKKLKNTLTLPLTSPY